MKTLLIVCPLVFILGFTCKHNTGAPHFIGNRSLKYLPKMSFYIKGDTPVYYLNYNLLPNDFLDREVLKTSVVNAFADTIKAKIFFDYRGNKAAYKNVTCFRIDCSFHADNTELYIPYIYNLDDFK